MSQKHVKSSIGKVKVLDISPGGLKIETVYNIPVNKPIDLQLTFAINDENFVLTGRVLWQIRRSKNFQYGIRLEATPDNKQKIIDELKKYSKKLYCR